VTSPPPFAYTQKHKEHTKEATKMMNPVASQLVGKYRVNDLLRDAERRRPLNLIQNEHPDRIQDLLNQFGQYLIIASDRLHELARFQRSDALG